jgi:hypothetical protein
MKIITTIVAMWLVLYLMWTFAVGEINPMNWAEIYRWNLVVSNLILALLVALWMYLDGSNNGNTAS